MAAFNYSPDSLQEACGGVRENTEVRKIHLYVFVEAHTSWDLPLPFCRLE